MGGRRTISDAQQRFERLTSVLKTIESGAVVTQVDPDSSRMQTADVPFEEEISHGATNYTAKPGTPLPNTLETDRPEHDALDLIERDPKQHRYGGEQIQPKGLNVNEDFLAQLLRVDLRTSASRSSLSLENVQRKSGHCSALNEDRLSLYRALALSKRKVKKLQHCEETTERRPLEEEEKRGVVEKVERATIHEDAETVPCEPLRFQKPLVGFEEALSMLEVVKREALSNALEVEREREDSSVSVAEAIEEHNDVRDVLLESISLFRRELPLTFLMEHNLNELGRRQGVETVMAIMRRFINALKAQAVEIWKDFAEASRNKEETDASTRIQMYYRGYKTRVEYQLRRKVAMRSVAQEMRTRSDDLHLRIASSLLLQRIVRGHFGRRIAAEERLVLKRVIQLQSLWRKKICSMYLIVLLEHREFKSRKATDIQRMVRAMCGRKRVHERRAEVAMEEQDKLLQNQGYVLRRKFIEVGAVHVISRAWRAIKFKRSVRFHGSIFAVRIQKVVRGHLVRVRVRPRLRLARFQAWVLASSGVLAPFAIKIQRSFHIMQSRKRLKRLRESAAEARARRIEEKRKILEASKNKLIKSMNPAKAVRLLKNTQAARGCAAVKIQALWRGKSTRVYVKHLKRKATKKRRQDAASLLQSQWRGYKTRRIMLHQQDMAKRIQQSWRARKAYMFKRQAEQSFIALQVVRRTASSVLVECEQEACRLVVQHLGHVQSTIAKHVRGRSSRLEFSFRLDQRRGEDESKLAGIHALEAAFLQERDRLLIVALYEHSKDICHFEPFRIFMERCEVQAVDPRWTRSRGPHLGGAAFARLCKDSGLSIGTKAKGSTKKRQKVSANSIDLVFAKAQADISKGSKVMQYPGFVRAMEILADKVFPEVTSRRKLQDLDARIVLLFEQYMLGPKQTMALNSRVHAQLSRAAGAIQSLYRMNKSKLAVQLRLLMETRNDKLKKQKAAALYIQTRFRQFRARKMYFRMVRSTFACYKDIELEVPYWMNPRTGLTSWTKPSILGDAEVDNVILVPPIRHQFVVYCERCETYGVSNYCVECEELQCKSCFEDFHKKGSRASHKPIPIKPCVNCQFQVASRQCSGCDNDCYCDLCWDNLHKKVSMKDHSFDLLLEVCQICGTRAARYSESGYQCCTYCLESSLGISPEDRVPMALHTLEMEKQRREQEEKRQKQLQEHLAAEREQLRLFHRQQAAAVKLQRYFRGWAIRRSSVGSAVVRALEEAKVRQREAEANKLSLKTIAKGAKQLSKGMAKKLGERLNELDSNGLDILSKLPKRQKRETTIRPKQSQQSTAAEPQPVVIERAEDDKAEVQQVASNAQLNTSSALETFQPNVNENDLKEVEMDKDKNLWTERYDEEHDCNYYYNEQTGESRWQNPAEEGDSEEETWERHYDESSGHYYFINTLTGEAVWEES